jgi:hypothetical protein
LLAFQALFGKVALEPFEYTPGDEPETCSGLAFSADQEYALLSA